MPQAPVVDVPVAIVGGGPVGLAVAVDLGWHGVDCVVIEQGDGQVGAAKFVDINMRTMEFCRRWGVAEEIRDRGFNRNYPQDLIYVTALTGYLLGRQPFPSFGQFRTPPTTPERIARCPQTIFDPILKRVAASYPAVRFRYGMRCDAVTQDAGRGDARANGRFDERALARARTVRGVLRGRSVGNPRATRDRTRRRDAVVQRERRVSQRRAVARARQRAGLLYGDRTGGALGEHPCDRRWLDLAAAAHKTRRSRDVRSCGGGGADPALRGLRF